MPQRDALRPLIFNLKRLIARRHMATPTGVDRVDLRHARYVLEQSEFRKTLFVTQQQGVFRLIPTEEAKRLIERLWATWVGSGAPHVATFADHANRLKHQAIALVRKTANHSFQSGWERELKSAPPPIYINSAQGGLDQLNLHQQLINRFNASPVYYLHDLIPIDYPEYVSDPIKGPLRHQQRLETMARTAALVLTNSHYTQQRFEAWCAEHGFAAPQIQVLPIGVEDHILAARNQALPDLPPRFAQQLRGRPFFLIVGTIEPRKNHLLLLHLWRELRSELKEQCPVLVIIGREGWRCEHIMSLVRESPRLQGVVMHHPQTTDAELIALLRHTRALLFPSFEEGWGMPLAEALALGAPAISSDIPALRECSQGLATHIPPEDGLDWKATIVSTFRQCRSANTATPQQFQPEDWTTHTRTLDKILTKL